MLKNMTVGKKIAAGFAVVLVLLSAVGLLAWRGVRSMAASARDAVEKNRLVEELSAREIDHLNWAGQLGALLTDDDVTELTVETDHTKCAFGKWLYGEDRTRAVEAIPELGPILEAIEEPHRHLHASATDIGACYRQADDALPGLLEARKIDHLLWAGRIRDALLTRADRLEVETDPHRCALGKWLDTDKARAVYEAGDAKFQAAWDRMLETHAKLHASATDIAGAIGRGDEEGRTRALALFRETTLPLLEGTLGEMEALRASAVADLEGMKQANRIYARQTMPALEAVQEKLERGRKLVGDVVEETNDGMLATARTTQWTVTIISGIAVVLGVSLATVIARGIISALKRLIEGLADGSNMVASASSQVSTASQQLAEGASEQAASIEETTASVEEMASMTKQNADGARQAKDLADRAQANSSRGSDAMERMSRAIDDIKSSSDETAKIVKTIDEIAFQTNLLALNAAVEAARAGEAGKGFAVVAEEVRNLAQRSAEAARTTSELIEASVRNAESGVDISKEVGEVLNEVAEGSRKVNELIGEIAAASEEQSRGIEQINIAVGQMDQVTQSNAANAEESASASEELNAQALELNNMVAQLEAMVGGADAPAPATPPRRRASNTSGTKGRAHQAAWRAAPASERTPEAPGGTSSEQAEASRAPGEATLSSF
jgi:methyl-accepting chemotaxis protein